MWNEEVPGTDELDYKPVRRILSAPEPADVDAAAEALINAKRPLIYAGQGVHYAQGVARAEGGRRAPRGAGHDQPRRQERVPGDASAVAGLGRRRDAQGRVRSTCRSRTWCSAPARASRPRASASASRRRTSCSSTTRSIRSTSTRTSRRTTRWSATRSSRSAMLHEALKERLKKPRGLTAEVHKRIREQNDPWMAEWMPRLTQRAEAAVAVSRDPGPDARRGRAEHDHHARCRQPARRAVAVLEAGHAAELHRLGQVDAARLRPGACDGREARASRTSCASTCGAMRPSA